MPKSFVLVQKSDSLVVASNRVPTNPDVTDPVEEFHETIPGDLNFRLTEVFRNGVDDYVAGDPLIPGDQAAWNAEVDSTIDAAVTLPDLKEAMKTLLKKVRFA